MERVKYELWAAGFAELDARQLEDARKRLKQRYSVVGPARDLVQEDWLLHGMLYYLRRRGLAPRSQLEDFLRTRWGRMYVEDSPGTRAWLEELMERHATNSQARVLVAELVSVALVRWLERKQLVPSPNLIFSSIASTQEALERCFPSYIRAGLFHKLLIAPRVPDRARVRRALRGDYPHGGAVGAHH